MLVSQVKADYAFNYKMSSNRNDHVEIMDHQDRRNHPRKFLDNGGNCNDCDDHMKTRLMSNSDLHKNMKRYSKAPQRRT